MITLGDAHFHMADRGHGRALVLVHGFPLDHRMWSGQVEALAATHRVLAPDLRGFGKSIVTAGSVSMEQMACDVAGLLDRAGVREGVVFCGLSMGGYVAWEFARMFADRLAGLILCDTRAQPDTPEAAAARLQTAQKVLAQGPRELAEGMLPKLLAAQTVREQPQLVEVVRQVMLSQQPEGIAAALRGMAARRDARELLPGISAPTLAIVGESDAISTVAEMREFSAQIPGAELVVVPHAGHLAPLENPNYVNQVIRRFLQRL